MLGTFKNISTIAMWHNKTPPLSINTLPGIMNRLVYQKLFHSFMIKIPCFSKFIYSKEKYWLYHSSWILTMVKNLLWPFISLFFFKLFSQQKYWLLFAITLQMNKKSWWLIKCNALFMLALFNKTEEVWKTLRELNPMISVS
jgi:hypothetical protein